MLTRASMIAFAALSASAAAAPPPCAQRVAALRQLSEREWGAREAAKTAPVELSFRRLTDEVKRATSSARVVGGGDSSNRAALEKRGATVVGSAEDAVEDFEAPLHASALRDLAGAANRVTVCIEQNAPVRQKLSLEADAALVAPMLGAVKTLAADERATKVAELFAASSWGCPAMSNVLETVQYVRPSDKLALIAQFTAESLEECKCPSADAERAFALLSVMADVWTVERDCVPLVLDASGAGPKVLVKGSSFEAFFRAIKAAGTKGVVLPKK